MTHIEFDDTPPRRVTSADMRERMLAALEQRQESHRAEVRDLLTALLLCRRDDGTYDHDVMCLAPRLCEALRWYLGDT